MQAPQGPADASRASAWPCPAHPAASGREMSSTRKTETGEMKMRTVLEMVGHGLTACAFATVVWAILAAPGFLSERDTVAHAIALTALASR